MKYLLTDLETDRLKFRLLKQSDFNTFLPFFNDRSIYKYLCLDESKSDEEICQFYVDKCLGRYRESRGGLMVVMDKNSQEFLGLCGLLVQNIDNEPRLEVGYSFLEKHRGKGYATEAATFAKNHAFEMGYDLDFDNTIVSMVHIENRSSAAVALRNEMTHEKQTTELNQLFDIFSVSRKVWLAQHGA
jgi:RimJ/RimL family protein N-acetyltransferase